MWKSTSFLAMASMMETSTFPIEKQVINISLRNFRFMVLINKINHNNSRNNLCHTLIGKVPLTPVDKFVYMVFKLGCILG